MGSKQALPLTHEEWVGGASHGQWESRQVEYFTHAVWAGQASGPQIQALRNKQWQIRPFTHSSEQVVGVGGEGPTLVYRRKTGLLTYRQWAGKASYSQKLSREGQGEPAGKCSQTGEV